VNIEGEPGAYRKAHAGFGEGHPKTRGNLAGGRRMPTLRVPWDIIQILTPAPFAGTTCIRLLALAYPAISITPTKKLRLPKSSSLSMATIEECVGCDPTMPSQEPREPLKGDELTSKLPLLLFRRVTLSFVVSL
jgi:hypothetical protein